MSYVLRLNACMTSKPREFHLDVVPYGLPVDILHFHTIIIFCSVSFSEQSKVELKCSRPPQNGVGLV